MISYLKPALKDIFKFPEDIKADLMDLLAQLDVGIKLSMPLSRPMPSIGKGVHELRLKDASGVYRIIYVFVSQNNIWVIHGFKKTTEQTSKQDIELAKKRLKEVL